MHSHFHMASGRRGFTLTELLAVLATAALLAGLAAPGFQRQFAAASLAAATRQTAAGLQLARQQALGTGSRVTVCPTPDGVRCAPGSARWMIFRKALPTGPADRRAPADGLLDSWQLPARVVVTGTRGYASFLPQTSAAATVTFHFCHPGAPAAGRSLIVSQTGRVRISRPVPASTAGPSGCP
jgi:type IV fimbrial biogenesis protein FimT